MSLDTFDFQEIDRTTLGAVGGKAANLGELARVEGISVPEGFCVSTEAFKRIIGETPAVGELLDRLSLLKAEDREKIAALSDEIRRVIEEIIIPSDVSEEIARRLSIFGEREAYAVRSSATAEDLPTASFAGQQETYLNVTGKEEILKHVSKCWASLFTERAIIYRLQNGFEHREVYLAVIVQKMIFPQVAGIMFTADPVSGHRKTLSIDAGFGLGEALVSGLVNADNYKVREGEIIDKKISAKKIAIYASENGGTQQQEIVSEQQNKQALTDEQILKLAQTGRKIEAHFGCPQDIEWCLADEKFYIVQSRPVTALFPVPVANDGENHVYISVGHQQMMTDAMRPLGISLWRLTAFHQAGGRLFVDVSKQLASPVMRENLLNMMGGHDPLMKDALVTLIERGDFIKQSGDENNVPLHLKSAKGMSAADIQASVGSDQNIVDELIASSETALAELKTRIRTKSGTALFDFILEDISELKKSISAAQNMRVIMAAMNAASWLNEKMHEWLGEKNAADTLSQSVPNNVTSEMGLALLDVADAIRPFPQAVAYLQQAKDDNFLDKLTEFAGGREAQAAISDFLDKYGMRCSGEIDITNPRWSEKPATLIPLILNNIKNFAPGESQRKFNRGQEDAANKEQDLLKRLQHLPDGASKAAETKQMIDLIRNFAGYREYPKYGIISRYFLYKQALMKEAARLVQTGAIRETEDVYFLTFEEFREAVSINQADYQIINRRKDEFKSFEKLTPPRVITSDGEVISGSYKRENLPAKAIIGLAVSSGTVEGRARVVTRLEDASLEDGDILVTAYTDPSWTPLFVGIKGLVTEVGGLMTHGAVIAREYGLPAIVGVENATKLIKDGQKIRVNGTEGYVEIL